MLDPLGGAVVNLTIELNVAVVVVVVVVPIVTEILSVPDVPPTRAPSIDSTCPAA